MPPTNDRPFRRPHHWRGKPCPQAIHPLTRSPGPTLFVIMRRGATTASARTSGRPPTSPLPTPGCGYNFIRINHSCGCTSLYELPLLPLSFHSSSAFLSPALRRSAKLCERDPRGFAMISTWRTRATTIATPTDQTDPFLLHGTWPTTK